MAKNQIIPTFGSRRIENIVGRDLDNLYRQMAPEVLSLSSIRYAHALISQVLSVRQ